MLRSREFLFPIIVLMVAACSADKGAPAIDGGVDGAGSIGEAADGSQSGAAGGAAAGGQSGTSGSDGTGGAPSLPDQLGVTDTGWSVPEELMLCGDRPCECANGVDDDGDGAADGFDLECIGPLDDDEGSFATGIPGDNSDPKWQDCFFDGDSGAGNDGCRYPTECLTGELAQDDPQCTLTQQCIEYCMARTPSGCDCFGCCTIQKDDGTTVNVLISADCTEDDLDACQTCIPSDDCSNECGECELCPGKTIEDLPDHCWTDDRMPPGGAGTGGSGGAEGTSGSGGTSGESGTGGTSSGDGTSGSGGSSSGGDGTSGSGGSSSGGDGTAGSGEPGGSGVPFTCDNGAQVCLNQAECPTGYYCLQGCCLQIVE